MAELYMIEFKGARKEYFYNTYYHRLNLDDRVIIQAERGEDIGVLLKKIETRVDFAGGSKPRSILRPAGPEDLKRAQELRQDEARYKAEVIGFIKRHGLPMKVVDVDCQFDGNKMTVYFTADHRVDFRELVKDLASQYKTRIELRQIGVRDEARRVDGYGICGRRQCCNSFIKDFAPISTQHAREQDLPMNPAKISGNCGRLLCCLKYEVDFYTAAKRLFPSPGVKVQTPNGTGRLERIDVFKAEAIIRTEENLTFRSRAEDIKVISHTGQGRGSAAAPGKSEDRDPATETDETAQTPSSPDDTDNNK